MKVYKAITNYKEIFKDNYNTTCGIITADYMFICKNQADAESWGFLINGETGAKFKSILILETPRLYFNDFGKRAKIRLTKGFHLTALQGGIKLTEALVKKSEVKIIKEIIIN